MSRRVIKTEMAPAPVGTYSQGIAIDGGRLLFTAGQIPLNPETNELIDGNIKEQTRLVLNNLKGVIEAAGSTMANCVKLTVFMLDLKNFAAVNEVFQEFFPENPPARSAVQVSGLPKGADIEIEGIALL
ncbi:RidA family protein [candidate division KSB1 bacterium]